VGEREVAEDGEAAAGVEEGREVAELSMEVWKGKCGWRDKARGEPKGWRVLGC
jgi:hypothetical protein